MSPLLIPPSKHLFMCSTYENPHKISLERQDSPTERGGKKLVNRPALENRRALSQTCFCRASVRLRPGAQKREGRTTWRQTHKPHVPAKTTGQTCKMVLAVFPELCSAGSGKGAKRCPGKHTGASGPACGSRAQGSRHLLVVTESPEAGPARDTRCSHSRSLRASETRRYGPCRHGSQAAGPPARFLTSPSSASASGKGGGQVPRRWGRRDACKVPGAPASTGVARA